LAADAAWLQLYLAWERREEPAVRVLMRWTLSVAPQANYFRVNSARIIAYDFPVWKMEIDPQTPAAAVTQWRRGAAEEAAALLLDGGSNDPELWLEAANIALYAGGDRELAARRYRRAAELPGAPWHAGRVHAQLLRELGRDREALDWLRMWSQVLPAHDPAAQRELVLARISELEQTVRDGREPL
jgi:tetratricopeptide (TPR) repeat protein